MHRCLGSWWFKVISGVMERRRLKPTQGRIKLNCSEGLVNAVIAALKARCAHPKVWWSWPGNHGEARYSFGAHLPIAGSKAEGSWAIKGAVFYPDAINVLLADLVMASGRRPTEATPTPRPGQNTRNPWTGADIPTSQRKVENQAAIGCMRHHGKLFWGNHIWWTSGGSSRL